TLQTLEIYREYITHIISEKDEGQSDAIAKGFKLSKKSENGHLMNWINSDDILTENGLYHIAKAWINNKKANIIYGKNAIMDVNSNIYSWMPHPDNDLVCRY